MPCLYVYNKVDAISLEQVDRLARLPKTVVISCEMDLNLDYLVDRIWEELHLVKIYTKKRGAHPDLSDPICLRKGATIEDVCNGIHRSLAANFRYGLIWCVNCRNIPIFLPFFYDHHIVTGENQANFHHMHRKSVYHTKFKMKMLSLFLPNNHLT